MALSIIFNENKLSTTIQFITTIIENLKKEKVDLLEKYGGDTSFVNKIDNDKAFVTLFLYENEGIYYDNESNILILKLLKRDVFENSLFYKKPHKVYIDD